MNKKILTYIDHFQGNVQPASWEALGLGAKYASEGGCAALVIGEGVQDLAAQAFQYGADQVFLAEHPQLKDFRFEPFADMISKVAKEFEADVLLFPTTIRCRSLAGMAAVDLETGVLVDITDLETSNGDFIATRPIYAGKLLAKVTCDAQPQIITIRPRAFSALEPDPDRSGEIQEVAVDLDPDQIPTTVVDYATREKGVSLTEAGVIVSGGRGTSNNPALTPPENLDEEEAEIWKAQQGFELIRDLADVLGAAVGASRAAVDADYIPYEHQVGQTGKVVSPDLYIACGISGAIQHLAGMRTSNAIVAINKDPDAPIFNLARFGVVGDLYNVLPPLTEALREKLS
jgi:electron transfer flavoprotein alpha subunit